MNLTIDVGNTNFKICVFDKNKLIHSTFTKGFSKQVYESEIAKFDISHCVFSSTRVINKSLFVDILPKHVHVMELEQQTTLPISINYKTPNTLGKDRIAAAVGANTLFPDFNCLIIDIGTALTIDFIDKSAVYHGGIISPGPETRYRALSEFTGKLPLLDCEEIELNLQGSSTKEAMHYGVQNGILFEINEYILRYTKQYKELKVIITGGYTYLFDKKINYPIFAELFLVPLGLNRILQYNDN